MTKSVPWQHFSMIRSLHLADVFTIANGFCGVAAIFEAMRFMATHHRSHVYYATLLIPVALLFDILDGRIARWRHAASPLGRELDSLADVISFGVAPATIAFALGLQTWLDQLLLLFFVGCGVSRLARYNVSAADMATQTGKVEYFEGTPIPTSILPLVSVLLAFRGGNLYEVSLLGLSVHAMAGLFGLSGCLMISKTLKIPKL